MENIGALLEKKYKDVILKKKVSKRGSELDAVIDEIGKVVEIKEPYGFNFWRGVLSKKKVAYGTILELLKKMQGIDPKYNKGAVLVNMIKKLPKKKPEMVMTLFGLQEKVKKRVIHKK